MLAESLPFLLTDLNHWVFELISDAVIGIALIAPAKWLWAKGLRRHDAVAHGIGHGEASSAVSPKHDCIAHPQPQAARERRHTQLCYLSTDECHHQHGGHAL